MSEARTGGASSATGRSARRNAATKPATPQAARETGAQDRRPRTHEDEPPYDEVDEASAESFPASDPPPPQSRIE